MQHMLSRARCDDRAMLDAAGEWAVGQLNGEHSEDKGDAILIVDETSDVKSSADCVGAARQYCGATGSVALCQVAVTLTYAVPAGHALIGRALCLPAGWAADEERRELAGVPDEIMFATKPELAGDLLRQAHSRDIRAPFIAGDEVYGSLDPRKSIRELGSGYVMAVRSNHCVTLPSGRRIPVTTAEKLVKPGMWQRMRTGSATKGAKDYHWAMIEMYKQVTGLDSGQVTTWASWHRWTAISLLAGAFLAAAAASQRARDGDIAIHSLIPVTVPELLRPLRGTVIPWPHRDQEHCETWSLWRRHHQYRARQAHQRWHAYADGVP
ncbi:MAG TPA: transposase [Thermomicrobiaceae bacterium]|nr:transposase [Thermomicrobiaceae bacterium]